MKAMHRVLIVSGFLVAACSPPGSKAQIQPSGANAVAASGGGFGALEAQAKVCGVHLLQKGVNGAGTPHSINLWGAAEICGANWHALGMQELTTSVFVRHAGTAAYDMSPQSLASVVADATSVYVSQGGKTTKVGALAGNQITPEPGVTFEIMVNGAPYQVGESKTTPDNEKAIYVTLNP